MKKAIILCMLVIGMMAGAQTKKQITTKPLQLNSVPTGLPTDKHLVIGVDKVVRQVTTPIVDGSETKVTGGANATVTGSGKTSDPYVVNANGTPTPTLQQVLDVGNNASDISVTISETNRGNVYQTVIGGQEIKKTGSKDNNFLQLTKDFINSSNGGNKTGKLSFNGLELKTNDTGGIVFLTSNNAATERFIEFPNNSGTLTMSVNGVAADVNGNVDTTGGVKTYIANLYQFGTNGIYAVIFNDNFDNGVTWTRESVGVYKGVLNGFSSSDTVVFISNSSDLTHKITAFGNDGGGGYVTINTYINDVLSDNVLNRTGIQIMHAEQP